jgi:hypothetical protein
MDLMLLKTSLQMHINSKARVQSKQATADWEFMVSNVQIWKQWVKMDCHSWLHCRISSSRVSQSRASEIWFGENLMTLHHMQSLHWRRNPLLKDHTLIIKAFFPQDFSDAENPSNDPWYMLSKWIKEFHNNRTKTVAASVIKSLDETMSAWWPCKDKTGGSLLGNLFRNHAFSWNTDREGRNSQVEWKTPRAGRNSILHT